MWIFTDAGDGFNLKFSRRLAVREAAKERVTYYGGGEIERRHIPDNGFCVLSWNGSVCLIAHRNTREECEVVLMAIRDALASGERSLDVREIGPVFSR